MDIISIIVIGFGLSMDAFAVSVTNGISLRRANLKTAFVSSFFFGFFQGLMPYIGWLLGFGFSRKIEVIDHWVAFALLAFIGINMIREAKVDRCEAEGSCAVLNPRMVLFASLATSIDALVVGVSMAFSGIKDFISMFVNSIIIAVITFIVCSIGFNLGKYFGRIFKNKAEIAGGIILILMGVRILIEHLFIKK
ncbi:MAG TPA: manganese efflux pump [Clostridiales bacterium]|nr:manganese efflux pump [Clostridiales bacterium]